MKDENQLTNPFVHFAKAAFDWLTENSQTTYISANTEDLEGFSDVTVFDITPGIVEEFSFTNSEIEFLARFKGVPKRINLKIEKIAALYSAYPGIVHVPNDSYIEPSSIAEKSTPVKSSKLKIVE